MHIYNLEATWYKYSETPPPIGVEVIAYNHKWINEDFNPKGTRVGFRTDENDFISAYWWDYQDDYVGISGWKCEGTPEFSDELIESREPEYWLPIPDFKMSEIKKNSK